MVLFLDFDGVLHPWPCPTGAAFRDAPRLLAVLDEHPGIDLAVTSSWRLLRHSAAWQEVPEALRARVTGCTPEIRRREHGMPVSEQPPIRYAEILRYLDETGQAEEAALRARLSVTALKGSPP